VGAVALKLLRVGGWGWGWWGSEGVVGMMDGDIRSLSACRGHSLAAGLVWPASAPYQAATHSRHTSVTTLTHIGSNSTSDFTVTTLLLAMTGDTAQHLHSLTHSLTRNTYHFTPSSDL